MTHLDLFSGIGGFAIAAQACGYTTIGFCEREPYAQQILKERFGAVLADAGSGRQSEREHLLPDGRKSKGRDLNRCHPPRLHPDIFTLNGADYAGVDLLTGGFPCQPFSVAGKRIGKADDRAIWPEMLRVIREAKPTWIIGENVSGIVTMELDNILSDLEGIGYAAWPLVIPACAVDARHRRDRVWIIARRNVEDSAGERSRGESGNALHEGRGASEAGGTGIPQATGRQNGSAIGDDWTTGQDVAYAASKQNNRERGDSERGRDAVGRHEQAARRRNGQADNDGTGGQGEDVAYADELHGNERGEYRQLGGRQIPESGISSCCEWESELHWFAESGMGRVAHGIPDRAHRLRGLGNSIVPQVAEEIIRAIASLE